MKFIDRLMEASRDTFRPELAAALAAALSAALLTSVVNLLNQHRVNPLAYLRFVFLATAAYSITACLIHLYWPTSCRRLAPNWIPISIIGSLLFVIVRLTPGVIKGWYDPLRSEESLWPYILNEIDAAKSVVIVLSAITLALAALAYYVSRMLSNARRRHFQRLF